MTINFKKMHGLGNDFVIIDGRENGLKLSAEQRRLIADRQRGVGCDQLIVIERSKNWQEMNFMRIYNPDGSEAEACGNATRCVAHLLMREDQVDNIILETVAGSLNCWREGEQLVRVEMGKPQLDWKKIPLSKQCDTLHLPLEGDPVGVSMGNPHCVFFVDKLGDIFLERVGKRFETDPLFPNKTNVEFAEVLAPDHIRMRVWERAAGITQACGSGACATAVAAIRRGLTDRKVTVTLDGGDLIIHWPSDDAPVSMTGPVTYVFDGVAQI
ncbi:MAG TPA: diaminopimelate epimerase [Alphaproteobacteria bacterium]|nr:diaminopimelate epimerase [Alphaproteobacteria bacterium]